MLERLGLRGVPLGGEQVAILVGPNGAGKSNFLKELAVAIRGERNLAVICNTAHDRFAGMRGINRISASRRSSPKVVIKQAIARTIDEPDSRFYQIGKILDYCGYRPRFGFNIERSRKRGLAQLPDRSAINPDDYEAGIAFLERRASQETLWIDPGEPALAFSRAREFAAVLRCEEQFRREGLLDGVQVYLQRHDGKIIELLHASSGELSLVSSLVFLITTLKDDAVILIDEPENSLHPSWQREYVDKVLNAVEYRNATIIIATHAPLIVTGALARYADLVSVFQVLEGDLRRLDLSDSSGSAGGIEEILWRAFEVVTPANHYVSEQLVGVITRLEGGEMARGDALAVVDELDSHSFDSRQREFFSAVRELIEKVDAERRGGARDHD